MFWYFVFTIFCCFINVGLFLMLKKFQYFAHLPHLKVSHVMMSLVHVLHVVMSGAELDQYISEKCFNFLNCHWITIWENSTYSGTFIARTSIPWIPGYLEVICWSRLNPYLIPWTSSHGSSTVYFQIWKRLFSSTLKKKPVESSYCHSEIIP